MFGEPLLKIGARDSKLSMVQVEEVFQELRIYHPNVLLKPIFVKTTGDIDKKTSLRGLEKTDFFTKEIDEMVLNHNCDAAIHSAKDLPSPLRKGLCIAAMTKGLDARDALVYRKALCDKPLVATSSIRREDCVKQILPNARFVDIRGTIQERLEQLNSKNIDAVVIAEAALIRLKLNDLPRLFLSGETAPYQGRLSIVVREDNQLMKDFFAPINYCYTPG